MNRDLAFGHELRQPSHEGCAVATAAVGVVREQLPTPWSIHLRQMHVIVGEVGILLKLDAERLQSAERGIGIVVERLKQFVLPARQAKPGIAGSEEEWSRHTREVSKCVLLAIVYACLLHEPVVRDPHPGDGFASGPADLWCLF